jgi:hypothetical protein
MILYQCIRRNPKKDVVVGLPCTVRVRQPALGAPCIPCTVPTAKFPPQRTTSRVGRTQAARRTHDDSSRTNARLNNFAETDSERMTNERKEKPGTREMRWVFASFSPFFSYGRLRYYVDYSTGTSSSERTENGRHHRFRSSVTRPQKEEQFSICKLLLAPKKRNTGSLILRWWCHKIVREKDRFHRSNESIDPTVNAVAKSGTATTTWEKNGI